MYKKVLFSLAITTIISVLFGFLFYDKFAVAFMLAFILQFVLSNIFYNIYTNRITLRAMELKNKELEQTTKQQATIFCPCNEKNPQTVDMSFNNEGVLYKCDRCEKTVKAEIAIKTVLTTQPIYFNDRPRTDN